MIGLLLILSIILSGCRTRVKPQYSDFYPTGEPYIPRFVTTTYALYDIVKQLTKDCELNVILMPVPETNPHSYIPSQEELDLLKDCEMLICMGGDMEEWTIDYTEQELNPDMRMMVIPFENEVYTFDNELIDYELRDNHYWLSIKHNMDYMEDLGNILKKRCGEDESIIDTNLQNYRIELKALDVKMTDIMNRATIKHLVFADQFPFQYFAEDYGLTYSALSDSCDADIVITQESIDLLVDEINQNNISCIFYTDIGDPKIVEEVINRTGCEAYMLKTCHGVPQEEFDREMSLTEILNYNIDVLEKVLCGGSE